jgi:hypothetical protein
MPCHLLTTSSAEAQQTPGDESFLGGRPKLPPNEKVPACRLCGAEQSFFFQLAFPEGYAWAGLSLATFACTSCADEAHLIPPMLEVRLPGADVTDDFLKSYEVNFKFVVFQTQAGEPRPGYRERVRFQRLGLDPAPADAEGNKIGGHPVWLQDDEAPRSYAGKTPMVFLLQLAYGFTFDTLPGAPPQMRIGLTGDPEPSPHPYYELFNANAVYLFGPHDRTPLVYALTQVP